VTTKSCLTPKPVVVFASFGVDGKLPNTRSVKYFPEKNCHRLKNWWTL